MAKHFLVASVNRDVITIIPARGIQDAIRKMNCDPFWIKNKLSVGVIRNIKDMDKATIPEYFDFYRVESEDNVRYDEKKARN